MERMLLLFLMLPITGFAENKLELEEAKSKKERVVKFPTDRTIGEVRFFDPESNEFSEEEAIPAKGEIVVPKGKRLWLLFADPKQPKNAPVDLSALDQLGPNDLHMIGIPFVSIPADSIRQLKRHESLTHIGLGPLSQVTDETLAPLAEMTGLEGLYLGEAEVTDAGLKHLRKLVKLKILQLTSTKITDDGLIHIKGMTKLKNLDLNYTEVTNEGLKHLANLTELEHLNFAATKIRGSGLIHLKKMTKLKWLDLMSSASGPDLVHLKPLTKLEWLRLGGKGIDDAALAHLTHLRHLKLLLLVDTKVTDEGAKKLQQALSGCEIRR